MFQYFTSEGFNDEQGYLSSGYGDYGPIMYLLPLSNQTINNKLLAITKYINNNYIAFCIITHCPYFKKQNERQLKHTKIIIEQRKSLFSILIYCIVISVSEMTKIISFQCINLNNTLVILPVRIMLLSVVSIVLTKDGMHVSGSAAFIKSVCFLFPICLITYCYCNWETSEMLKISKHVSAPCTKLIVLC